MLAMGAAGAEQAPGCPPGAHLAATCKSPSPFPKALGAPGGPARGGGGEEGAGPWWGG